MSDVAEVKEALEIWDEYPEGDSGDPVYVIVDAARRWVRVVSEGERVKWCLTHGQSAPPCGARMNCNIESWLVAAVGVEKDSL